MAGPSPEGPCAAGKEARAPVPLEGPARPGPSPSTRPPPGRLGIAWPESRPARSRLPPRPRGARAALGEEGPCRLVPGHRRAATRTPTGPGAQRRRPPPEPVPLLGKRRAAASLSSGPASASPDKHRGAGLRWEPFVTRGPGSPGSRARSPPGTDAAPRGLGRRRRREPRGRPGLALRSAGSAPPRPRAPGRRAGFLPPEHLPPPAPRKPERIAVPMATGGPEADPRTRSRPSAWGTAPERVPRGASPSRTRRPRAPRARVPGADQAPRRLHPPGAREGSRPTSVDSGTGRDRAPRPLPGRPRPRGPRGGAGGPRAPGSPGWPCPAP